MQLTNSTEIYPNISPKTQNIITTSLNDRWSATVLAGLAFMQPAAKGAVGETIISDILVARGHVVTGKDNPGHDRIVNHTYKTECKFSGLNAGNGFIFNHFSVGKDWHRAILMALDVEYSTIVWFTKEDFILHLQDPNCFFNRQQSGANGNNDDWMYNTNRIKANTWQNFLKLPWVKSLEEW